MNTSHTTVTPPPDFSNTTDNDFNETVTKNNTSEVTKTTISISEVVTNSTTGYGVGDDVKSGHSVFLLQMGLPFGCLFIILVIFFVFYRFKLRKTSHGTIGMNAYRKGQDNDSFQPDNDDIQLQVRNKVKTSTRSSTSENRQNSTVAQNRTNEQRNMGLDLQDFDTIELPKPTRRAVSGEIQRNSAAVQNEVEDKESKLNRNLEDNVDVAVSASFKSSTTDDGGSSFITLEDKDNESGSDMVISLSPYDTVIFPTPTRRAVSD